MRHIRLGTEQNIARKYIARYGTLLTGPEFFNKLIENRPALVAIEREGIYKSYKTMARMLNSGVLMCK